MKKILCLDFDGVIHSYTSGWQGATSIPDSHIPGSLEFLVAALDNFRVAIFSSRSNYFGGRKAMKKWLWNELVTLAVLGYEHTPKWWNDRIARTAFADPYMDEVKWAASQVVKQIEWPKHKPPATLTIDDRAMRFNGVWPSFDAIKSFKPYKHNMELKTIMGGDVP